MIKPKSGMLLPTTHNFQWTKNDLNADADHETQLVPMEGRETLEGQVDINKVKEIRRAIRRRYASRSNYQKIFKNWDKSQRGMLDSKDIQNMVTTLGIKINDDEAKVLLASADSNGDNLLAVDEFIELIFSQNDALNIDLSKIPKEDLVVSQGKEQ
jgi:hypothetical protein